VTAARRQAEELAAARAALGAMEVHSLRTSDDLTATSAALVAAEARAAELQRSVAARGAAGGGAFHARGRRKFDAQASTVATPQQATGAEAQAQAEGAQAQAEVPEWGEVRRLQAALDEAARCIAATAATATSSPPPPSPSPPTPRPHPHPHPQLHHLQACRRAGDGAARRASALAAGASGRATTELAARHTRHIHHARPARHVGQRIDGLAEHSQLGAQRCVVHGRAGPEDGSAAALTWQAQVAAVREGLASAHVGGAQLAKARGTVACAGRVDRPGLTAALTWGVVALWHLARGTRGRHAARSGWTRSDLTGKISRECERKTDVFVHCASLCNIVF
jgi:hypothetical protein